MHHKKKSMGLFTMIGRTFGTIGTVVDAVDNTVSNVAQLSEKAFQGINLPLDNMLADLQCDNIVEDAERDVRIITAQAEADEIRKSLNKPTKAKARTTTRASATKK